MTVHFIGAGPGAADLLTLRAADRLARAEIVIWASSLVAPEVRRVAFDLQDIAKHGDDYVRSIRAEAARIIQDANAEAVMQLAVPLAAT